MHLRKRRWEQSHFLFLLGDANIISSVKADGSVDLNNVSGNVTYYFDDSLPLNGPTGKEYGMFIQRQKARLRTQIWYDWGSENTEVYSRYVWNNNGWTTSPWMRLDNFGCSTAADLASLLGVPKLPQNTTVNIMMPDESKLTQKVNMVNNRGAGIVLWNDNGAGEGVFVFAYNSTGSKMTAKLLIKRVDGDHGIPRFYYDGSSTVAIKAPQTWSSWVIISSNTTLPFKGTVDSDLTGFTEITIQQ